MEIDGGDHMNNDVVCIGSIDLAEVEAQERYLEKNRVQIVQQAFERQKREMVMMSHRGIEAKDYVAKTNHDLLTGS